MKKIKTSRLLDNKTFCKIISVIGAITIWATVTLTVKTDSERLFRNVPIDFSVAGTAVEALGLSSFDRSDENINITLSGNRGSLNAVSKEDFVVSLSLGRVTKAGKYTVRVDVSLKEPVGNVSVVNYSPKTIQVSFDRSASKTFTIDTDISGISAKDGFMLDKGYPSSQE
ncbi:MAG: CdaR family protein, partial [Oscillospiraceae bacterium]|nr:CdaR family protein [Oscillospiraceae bacterium]